MIYLIGLNHNTAPLETRESLAINQHNTEKSLAELCQYVSRGIILSTCNRTEFYLWVKDSEQGCEAFSEFLKHCLGIDMASVASYFYYKDGCIAAEHLLRVACGIESMIIGEHEVLGQVNNALMMAEKYDSANLALRKLFNAAIRAGRRARNETSISRNPVSASSMAVDIALEQMPAPERAHMLVIGTGEAGKLVTRSGLARGIKNITVASRFGNSLLNYITEPGIKMVDYSCLEEELLRADIIVTCAESPHYLLHPHQLENTMARRYSRKLTIIDIGLPRNVDPCTGDIEGVFLYNIDDIGQACKNNMAKRQADVDKVLSLINEELGRFEVFYNSLNVQPLIRSLTRKAEAIRSCQLEATMKNLNTSLSPDEQYKIEAMTKAIVSRILQEPIISLKQNPGNRLYADVTAELFKLGEGTRS